MERPQRVVISIRRLRFEPEIDLMSVAFQIGPERDATATHRGIRFWAESPFRGEVFGRGLNVPRAENVSSFEIVEPLRFAVAVCRIVAPLLAIYVFVF